MLKSGFAVRRKPSGSRPDKDGLEDAFHDVAFAVMDFHRVLKKARKEFHRRELPDPKWNVITILAHAGPQTVPQIARARTISRQGVQNTVNLLHNDGYVYFDDNPAHKKSSLVRLTLKGEALADEMTIREREIISQVRLGIKAGEMRKAAQVIKTLKTFFESEQWADLVEESGPARKRKRI